MGAAPRRHPVATATAISALLSAAYLIWQPRTLDLAAQTFRADLWAEHGWVLWNDAWYGGHTVPGYSLIYPPLGALLGPELLGALCAVAASALFALIAARAYGERAWLGAAWFGAGSTVAAFGGRTAFALGVVLGLGAALAIQQRRPLPAALAGAAAALASPVAGLFTALAAGSVLLADRFGRRGSEAGSPPVGGFRRAIGRFPPMGIPLAPGPSPSLPSRSSRAPTVGAQREPEAASGQGRGGPALAAAAAATLATLAMALAFPTDGYQPFDLSSWIWIPVLCAAALLAIPREERVLRFALALYAVVGIAAFVFETPLGGNAVRLGATFAGPVLALVLLRTRPVLLALVAAPLLWWQWTATARDVVDAEGDPSTEAAYYEPVLAELDGLTAGEQVRIHVPPTRNRWESVHLAERYPLARGWLRQLESDDLQLFRDGGLTAKSYEAWLRERGVSYVAVDRVEHDYLADDEVPLIDGGLPYLEEAYAGDEWTLWRVVPEDREEAGGALAGGGAEITALEPDRVSVSFPGPGTYRLAVRWTPYFEIESGAEGVCVAEADDGFTVLTVEEPDEARPSPGEVEIVARLSLGGLLRRGQSCSA